MKGARSPKLKGRYAIDEALGLILENTDLTSIRDEQSGAYFIKQSVAALSTEVGKEVVEEIKAKPNQQTDTNDLPTMNSNTQEKPKLARKVFKGLLSIALLGGVQTATA
ncbi:MAG: STN domain-containing protein, partial [Verrucomicrobiia bacterium]